MKPAPAAATEAEPAKYHAFGAMVLMAVVTLVAYWPALHGGLVWDDDGHVTRPSLQSLEGLKRIWFELGATQQYYPLLHSAFWVEHRLWGDAVVGYYLTNILLHATSACLVVLIVRWLFTPAKPRAFPVGPAGMGNAAAGAESGVLDGPRKPRKHVGEDSGTSAAGHRRV